MADIYTLSDLQAIDTDLSGAHVLKNDINASATTTWNGGAGFIPLGSQASPFLGSFDGQGYTISNLYINRPGSDYQGLFGSIASTTSEPYSGVIVQNLNITDASITGRSYVGLLAGAIGNDGVVTNISVTGTVTGTYTLGASQGYSIGGLAGLSSAGKNDPDAYYVANCSSNCTVAGQVNVGGLIGSCTGKIYECSSVGNAAATTTAGILGVFGVGGLVGTHSGWPMERCFSEANANGTGNQGVGGLAGRLASGSTAKDCYSKGSVTGDLTGAVTAVGIGGLIGVASSSPTIVSCYSNGAVTGVGTNGGFIGRDTSGGYTGVLQCFWDTETSGMADGVGMTDGLDTGSVLSGKTTAEMGTASTFPTDTTQLYNSITWNLWQSSVWIYCDYPLLKWHDPTCPVPPVTGGFWARLSGTTQTFS